MFRAAVLWPSPILAVRIRTLEEWWLTGTRHFGKITYQIKRLKRSMPGYRHACNAVWVSFMMGPMEEIIQLLQKNALMPRDEMARLLNKPQEEVESAIAALESDGVILGYQPVLNREKWGTNTVTAVIEVKITPERDGGFDRIASRIAKFEEVQSCYLVSGGYDLLIVVEAPNLRRPPRLLQKS